MWLQCGTDQKAATRLLTYLHSNEAVVHHDFLCQADEIQHMFNMQWDRKNWNVQVGANSSLVLIAKPLVHVLVHERRLPDTATTKNTTVGMDTTKLDSGTNDEPAVTKNDNLRVG
jgi:hypothetical protein